MKDIISMTKMVISKNVKLQTRDADFILENCPKKVLKDWTEIINLVGKLNVKVNWELYEFQKNVINTYVGKPTPQIRVSIKGCEWSDVAFHQYGTFHGGVSDEEIDEINESIVYTVRYFLFAKDNGSRADIKREVA